MRSLADFITITFGFRFSVHTGDTHLHAHGLGAYIAQATEAGDMHRVVFGITVMSFYVVIVNRLLWRPLYRFAEQKFRLG
jgi:NitT/TauT family transport system permease protein